jgi:Ca2+-binding EF-hand superfamily protein
MDLEPKSKGRNSIPSFTIIPSKEDTAKEFAIARRLSNPGKIRVLSEITEDPAETIHDEESPLKKRIELNTINRSRRLPVINKLPNISEALPKEATIQAPLHKKVLFFKQFLSKLSKHSDVFELFIEQAEKQGILNNKKNAAQEYYKKFIHLSNAQRYKIHNRTPSPLASSLNKSCDNMSFSSEEYNIHDDSTPSIPIKDIPLMRKELFNIKSRVMNEDKSETSLSASSEKSKISKISKSSIHGSSNVGNKLRKRAGIRNNILDKNNPRIIDIFRKISKSKPNEPMKHLKVSSSAFRGYLLERYPSEVVDKLMKGLDLSSPVTFDDYCTEIDKFLSFPDDKQLYFCFELYDLNNDRYICYSDIYKLLTLQNGDIFDQDIVKIKNMFGLKKKKKISTPGYKKTHSRRGKRRHSINKNGDPSPEEDLVPRKKRVPHYHPEKSEALTFDDFLKIDFQYTKPQILNDFTVYICDYNIYEANGFIQPVEHISRKNSEQIVADMTLSAAEMEVIMKDPRFEYYAQLEKAMELYPVREHEILFSKFKFLKSDTMKKIRVISKDSLLQKFVRSI